MRQALDNQVQKQPIVLHIQLHVLGRREQRCKFGLKALEQTEDQRLFAMEVVVEVARADA